MNEHAPVSLCKPFTWRVINFYMSPKNHTRFHLHTFSHTAQLKKIHIAWVPCLQSLFPALSFVFYDKRGTLCFTLRFPFTQKKKIHRVDFKLRSFSISYKFQQQFCNSLVPAAAWIVFSVSCFHVYLLLSMLGLQQSSRCLDLLLLLQSFLPEPFYAIAYLFLSRSKEPSPYILSSLSTKRKPFPTFLSHLT